MNQSSANWINEKRREKMKTLNIVVWGWNYEVTFSVDDAGMFESGYAKGSGKIDKDSMAAQVINNILKGE